MHTFICVDFEVKYFTTKK